MGVPITVLVVFAVAQLVLLALSLRNVQQYEKGVVFRFGRLLPDIRGPGLRVIRPIGDRMRKVSVQTEVLGIPPQGSITADNVTLTVDAVVYFKVIDPVKALVNVRDYPSAVSQIAQTSLRAVIGRADLDTLLSDRDHINARRSPRCISRESGSPSQVATRAAATSGSSVLHCREMSTSRLLAGSRRQGARTITMPQAWSTTARTASACRSSSISARSATASRPAGSSSTEVSARSPHQPFGNIAARCTASTSPRSSRAR